MPAKRPVADLETKKITAQKKEIYTQKKPSEEITTSEENLNEAEVVSVIYPEKKPIIFKKKIDKAVSKSEILSSTDLKIAKAAFKVFFILKVFLGQQDS